MEYDSRDGVYRVVLDGEPLVGENGRPLGFEEHLRATEVAQAQEGGGW